MNSHLNRSLAGLAIALLATPVFPAGAAPSVANAIKSGDEIRVPSEYAWMKLRRYPDKVLPFEYHVVVDVTPGKRGQATIARSSGAKAVDAVALDFADAYSTQVERLREMRKTREMRFPLVFDLRQAVGKWSTPLPEGAVSTRTTLSVGGIVMIRVATGPDGRISSTKIIKSSGLERFDDALADYARKHWFGPPNSATIVNGFAGPGRR